MKKSRKVWLFVIFHAVALALWFIFQQALFREYETSLAQVLFLSGLGAVPLIAISMLRGGGLPLRKSWPWFACNIAVTILVGECLVRATKEYGAALGANAMGFAPIVAIFVGGLIQRRIPSRLAILGIFVVFLGVYVLHLPDWSTTTLTSPMNNIPGLWLLYAVLIGVGGGIGLVTSERCIKYSDEFMAPGITLICSFSAYGLFQMVRGELVQTGNIFPSLDVAGWLLAFLMALFFGLANWASYSLYSFALPAIVGALKRLFAPVAVLLAMVVFQDAHNLVALLIGSALMVLGAVLSTMDKSQANKEDHDT